jgi:hypothetical protein
VKPGMEGIRFRSCDFAAVLEAANRSGLALPRVKQCFLYHSTLTHFDGLRRCAISMSPGLK